MSDDGVILRCHMRMYDPTTSTYRGQDTGIVTAQCTINITPSAEVSGDSEDDDNGDD